MRLIALSIAAALVLALVASQLLLPGYLENRVEDRLTADGGTAAVELEAVPALRLLFHDGSRLGITGRDLIFDLKLSDLRARPFGDFDGFGEVDLRLRDFEAGPFQVRAFDLERPSDADEYELRLSATTTPPAVAAYGSSQLFGLLGAVVGGTTAAVLQGRGRIPIEATATLRSDDGRVQVMAARGTVGGLQVGPLVQLLAGAVLARV